MIIIIILCVFFSIVLPSASTYGISSVFSHWNSTSIQVRWPYSLLLMIVLLLLTSVGFLILIIVFLIENQWSTWTFFCTNAMLIGLYTITSYRTWMSFYKYKFQRCLGSYEVDEMFLAYNQNWASNYWNITRAPIGVRFGTFWEKFFISRRQAMDSSFKFFIFFGLLLTIVNFTLGCNANGVPYHLESPFTAYDYYNMGVSTSFFIFNFILTCSIGYNFRHGCHCTGEVLRRYCYLAVLAIGFSLVSCVTSIKCSVDDQLVIAIIIWMTMLLFIQLIINWTLCQENVSDCSSNKEPFLHDNFKIDDILNNALVCKQFEYHLRNEFSLENLNFLKACDRYQDLLSYSTEDIDSSGAEGDCRDDFLVSFCSSIDFHRRKTIVARSIYEQFCAQGAPQEINLGRRIRYELREVFESNRDSYGKEVFDDAVICIKDLLTNDSLRRFRVEMGDFIDGFKIHNTEFILVK
jgi:hypothetical protein